MMYEMWLAGVRPLTSEKKKKLRACAGDAKAVYYMEETRIKEMEFLSEKDRTTLAMAKKQQDIEKEYEKVTRQGISVIPYYMERYPQRLHQIPSAPYALYCKGKLPEEHQKTVAIVGARKCTPYGEQLALEYGEVLAKAGVQIISGMARGIDGAAQRGALNGQGVTYGILGCGVDICYPKEHQGLYMDIQKKGGILSEQPPGEPPFASYFPARNRIISGLADAVLVLEAREKSGSLITADMALEQGKDVYALPGPVTSPMSQGCHRLIQQGADILLSPEELLKDLGISWEMEATEKQENKKVLESTENMVYSCLDLFPKSVHELVDLTKREPEVVMRELVSLQLEGKVEEISKNYYVRTRR